MPKFGKFLWRILQHGKKSSTSSLNLCAPNKLTQITVLETTNMKQKSSMIDGVQIEAATRGALWKKAWPATLFKKRLRHRCFPVNFAKCLRTRFFCKTPPVAASGNSFCSCGIVVHSKQVILWLNYLYRSCFVRLVLIWTGCCFY